MTPICELHPELHADIKEIKQDVKDAAKERREQISVLERSKLSWKTFTWIVGVLLMILLAVQGAFWNNLSHLEGKILEKLDTSDRDDGLKRAETWRRIGELTTSVNRLEVRFDEHLKYHGEKK